MEEQTFLIPRKVKTEWDFLGMKKRHMLLVTPWATAALLVYYMGERLPPWLHVGIPIALAGLGYVGFGWAGGEDDRTAWELFQRWWRHTSRQTRYLYRKERTPWRTHAEPQREAAADSSPTKSPASSACFPPGSASISRAK